MIQATSSASKASPHLKPLDLSYEVMGQGPVLLLLHGFPQTRAIWRAVAEQLKDRYTLVMPDLRGYGASPKPESDPEHLTYSKRAMANDMAALMDKLGFEKFGVVGHDRGGRVAHRLAADFSSRVTRLMVLDISPTLTMYRQTDMTFAAGYWHWFFLIQQAPLPETLIGAQPEFFMNEFMVKRYPGRHIFAPEAWEQYLACVKDPACLHAMCEDYRASATIDLVHDQEDRDAQRQLPMPMRVLWGQHGMIQKCFSPLKDWSDVATEVSGQPLDAGHYLPEECPQAVAQEIRGFFPV
jgi:haloacetate dehalogenase